MSQIRNTQIQSFQDSFMLESTHFYQPERGCWIQQQRTLFSTFQGSSLKEESGQFAPEQNLDTVIHLKTSPLLSTMVWGPPVEPTQQVSTPGKVLVILNVCYFLLVYKTELFQRIVLLKIRQGDIHFVQFSFGVQKT